MQITEVRVKLASRRNDKLRAYCSVTFDNAFVIRDLKIIEGDKGPFIAMPSRKLADRCPSCSFKNHLRAKYCNECGTHLTADRTVRDPQGRPRLHADIAHPINAGSRETIEKRILTAFAEEVERSKQPGYQPIEIFDSPEDYEDPLNV